MGDPWADPPAPTPPTKNLPSLSADRWKKLADALHIPQGVRNAAGDVAAGMAALAADARTQNRIDGFFNAAPATYKVGATNVSGVEPFFRMTNSWNERHLSADQLAALVTRDAGRSDAAFDRAAGHCAYGRGSPEEVRMVTQALIDKGKLADVRSKYEAMPEADFKAAHGNVSNHPLSDKDAIKLLQWDYGIGIDCAGYVQQAFLATHDGTRATYGFRSLGEEDLYKLRTNDAFAREATPVHARPGDLLILSPPPGDNVGHTVLVRDRHEMDGAERGGLTGLGTFASPTDTVHRIQVDASWGANYGNLENGGVQRREFLFNESTGKWADVEKGAVVPQAVGPYHGHSVEGVYHPKR